MTESTIAILPEVPSQLAFDNLVETLAALVDELNAITGCGSYLAQGTLLASCVPPEVWHALPHKPITFGEHNMIWKEVARKSGAHISVFCAHDKNCPDMPPAEVDEP